MARRNCFQCRHWHDHEPEENLGCTCNVPLPPWLQYPERDQVSPADAQDCPYFNQKGGGDE